MDLATLPFTAGETSSSAIKRDGLPLPNARDPKKINVGPGTSTIASASSTATPVAPEETSLMRLCNAAWAALRPLTGHTPETAEILSMESPTLTLAICDVRTSPIHDAAWQALGPFTTQTPETAKIVAIDGSDVILVAGDGDVRQIQIDDPNIRAPIEAYLEHILEGGDGDVRQIQIDDPNIRAPIEVYLQNKNYTPPPLKNDIAAKLKEQDTNGKLKYPTTQALWVHLEPNKRIAHMNAFDEARGDVSLRDALADLKTFSRYKKDALQKGVRL